MHALILLLALVFSPVQQDTLTIRDCILREGMSSALTGPATFNDPQYDAEGQPVNLYDRPGMMWADYADVLINANHRALVTMQTDTGNRPLLLLDYNGEVYVFVFMHRDNPRKRLPHESPSVWHGICMLRLL